MTHARLLLAFVSLALAGCPVGPDYEPPAIHAPEEFRAEIRPDAAASLADLPWWDVFGDPVLQRLVSRAIEGNYDLRVAAARVRQSSSFVGIARSEIFPQVGYNGSGTRQKSLIIPGTAPRTFNLFSGAFNLAWEIDLWGRIRRATEAAEADFFAAEEAQRGILLSLVSGVAEEYFQLIELDRELVISRTTVESFQKSLDLFQQRYDGGVGSKLAVARAEAALADVAATIPALEAQIVSSENEINLLLGRNPGPVARGAPLVQQQVVPEIPAGLPSELLIRRPDLRQAEDRIRAANADIGVAIANFFPRIGLSGLYGSTSLELSDMLNGVPGIWNIAAAVSGPIFTGGLNYEQYQANVAAWEAEVASYEQTVLQAFAEVSNLLTAHQNLVQERAERERAVRALQQSVDLSFLRYEIGLASYFEVLEAQQQLFPAELDLARVRRDQLLVVARLYRALGGGWELADDEWLGPAAVPPTGSPAAPAGSGSGAS